MKNSTVIQMTIGACVTIATSFILLYYFRRKKERSFKEKNLEKQTKSAERSVAKSRGRFQISRHVSRMKKANGSAKMRHTTSSDTSGDSSTKPEKSRNQYSSENYPPAIIWKHKELPKVLQPSEKSEELRDNKMSTLNAGKVSPLQSSATGRYDKTKSGEPVGVKKLSVAEETPSSPKEIIPIDSYCYCGQDIAISPDAAGELNENCKVELLPTIVKPVSFDPYLPEDLTQVEGASDEMSRNSMQMSLKPKNHHIIIPFLPILHAITYASKHGQLLQELLQNYEYFESQFT